MRCPTDEFDLSLLYHHFQSPRKHIEMFTVKGEDLAVHHDINRSIESEVDVADTMARRERMIQVCAVIKRVQVAQEAEAADRAPADEFDQAIVGLGTGRNHHLPAGEFAVIEGEEKAAAFVGLALSIQTQRKCATVEPSEATEQRKQIAELTEPFESAHASGSNIGGETHTQKVDVVDRAALVGHADDVLM